MIAFEAQEGITYDVEFIRHFELIPAEESTMETKRSILSDNFSNPLDIIRRYKVDDLFSNPFTPSAMSTGTTVWQTDPIYTANRTNVLK